MSLRGAVADPRRNVLATSREVQRIGRQGRGKISVLVFQIVATLPFDADDEENDRLRMTESVGERTHTGNLGIEFRDERGLRWRKPSDIVDKSRTTSPRRSLLISISEVADRDGH